MKDIQQGLKERLRAIQQEREYVTHRLETLDRLEEALRLIITEEDASPRATAVPQLRLTLPTAPPRKNRNGHSTLGRSRESRFILETLSDGKAMHLKELVQLAEHSGINFGARSPGRVLHYILVGLKGNGYSEMVAPSVWRLSSRLVGDRAENGIGTPIE